MNVVITGGTGFVGRPLVAALLARGHEVVTLVRDVQRARDVFSTLGARSVPTIHRWTDAPHADWARAVAAADALVHLAGEPVFGGRWTPAVKARLRASRLDTTARLVAALSSAADRARVLVSASAIGFYGARPAEVRLDEDAPPGTGFLAELTEAWEAAAERATEHGVRVVRARLGIVLGRNGGALAEMVKPFRLFAGGPIGDGRQVTSWIHLEDTILALLACIDDSRLQGAVNVVAPAPVTNAELARELGRALHRPSWLPVPAAALRARFGEAAEALLTGQRVVPRRLEAVGFEWRYPELTGALRELFG